MVFPIAAVLAAVPAVMGAMSSMGKKEGGGGGGGGFSPSAPPPMQSFAPPPPGAPVGQVGMSMGNGMSNILNRYKNRPPMMQGMGGTPYG